MRWALLIVGLSACTGQRTVEVVALRGDQPEPGAHVISHRPSGERIATVDVGADGVASVPVEDDSLVMVVYPQDAVATRVYTVAVTGGGDEIVIHGPAQPAVPPTIGHIDIALTAAPPADVYEVMMGCVGFSREMLPDGVDIDHRCVGRDGRIPIVVTALTAATETAYASGFVRLVNGTATFEPTTWSAVVANIPIVAPDLPDLHVEWSREIDGVHFGTSDISTGTSTYGLPIEGATVSAWVGDLNTAQQLVTRHVTGTPSQLAFGTDDFLAALPRTMSVAGMPARGGPTGSLTFTWAPHDVGADLVDISMGWITARVETTVLWDVAMPPESTTFRTPAFEGEISDLSPRDQPSLLLRYIDDPQLAGFGAAKAAGIFSLEWTAAGTIVTPPAAGELRETRTIGFDP